MDCQHSSVFSLSSRLHFSGNIIIYIEKIYDLSVYALHIPSPAPSILAELQMSADPLIASFSPSKSGGKGRTLSTDIPVHSLHLSDIHALAKGQSAIQSSVQSTPTKALKPSSTLPPANSTTADPINDSMNISFEATTESAPRVSLIEARIMISPPTDTAAAATAATVGVTNSSNIDLNSEFERFSTDQSIPPPPTTNSATAGTVSADIKHPSNPPTNQSLPVAEVDISDIKATDDSVGGNHNPSHDTALDQSRESVIDGEDAAAAEASARWERAAMLAHRMADTAHNTQFKALQSLRTQLNSSSNELSVAESNLTRELMFYTDKIAALQKLCAENDGASASPLLTVIKDIVSPQPSQQHSASNPSNDE